MWAVNVNLDVDPKSISFVMPLNNLFSPLIIVILVFFLFHWQVPVYKFITILHKQFPKCFASIWYYDMFKRSTKCWNIRIWFLFIISFNIEREVKNSVNRNINNIPSISDILKTWISNVIVWNWRWLLIGFRYDCMIH